MDMIEEKVLGCPVCGYRIPDVDYETPKHRMRCPCCRSRILMRVTEECIEIDLRKPLFGSRPGLRRV